MQLVQDVATVVGLAVVYILGLILILGICGAVIIGGLLTIGWFLASFFGQFRGLTTNAVVRRVLGIVLISTAVLMMFVAGVTWLGIAFISSYRLMGIFGVALPLLGIIGGGIAGNARSMSHRLVGASIFALAFLVAPIWLVIADASFRGDWPGLVAFLGCAIGGPGVLLLGLMLQDEEIA